MIEFRPGIIYTRTTQVVLRDGEQVQYTFQEWRPASSEPLPIFDQLVAERGHP